jgi:starch phosphorylase
LRLWSARATSAINLAAFNKGDYIGAVEARTSRERLPGAVPGRQHPDHGRELRLRQEYFFVSASLQDILRRHLRDHGSLDNLADKVAIHLNDTHPAIGVAELMRLLVDEHGMDWDSAWAHARRIFSYTNHTLMPEALETWPVDLMQHVLPRHLRSSSTSTAFLAGRTRTGRATRPAAPRVADRRARPSAACAWRTCRSWAATRSTACRRCTRELMSEDHLRRLRAPVARALHQHDQRRHPAALAGPGQPGLSKLIDDRIGPNWRRHLDQLAGCARWPTMRVPMPFRAGQARQQARLAALDRVPLGITVDPGSLFDVQVKRIHEYKRQLLNVLHVVTRYQAILAEPAGADWVPRTVIFAGKAAPRPTTWPSRSSG